MGKPEYGYRKAEMPKHCGNCMYHEWGGYVSRCRNTARIPVADIRERLIDEEDELRDDDPEGREMQRVSECIEYNFLDEQEWHPYDHVCNLHASRTGECFALHEAQAILWSRTSEELAERVEREWCAMEGGE